MIVPLQGIDVSIGAAGSFSAVGGRFPVEEEESKEGRREWFCSEHVMCQVVEYK
ncbi:hypothetical protein [Pseudomonas batumici]|uniref:hypothetical protein n=1 Tax=Pseudomonas batumici TaxID=226910 RepID=UPI0012EE147D|nr:hypothetical protein [Pseudomonas batumici]